MSHISLGHYLLDTPVNGLWNPSAQMSQDCIGHRNAQAKQLGDCGLNRALLVLRRDGYGFEDIMVRLSPLDFCCLNC